jgi:hypothetical protein
MVALHSSRESQVLPVMTNQVVPVFARFFRMHTLIPGLTPVSRHLSPLPAHR